VEGNDLSWQELLSGEVGKSANEGNSSFLPVSLSPCSVKIFKLNSLN
jgi:hypothetical protein